eukprot:EG_transcript_7226
MWFVPNSPLSYHDLHSPLNPKCQVSRKSIGGFFGFGVPSPPKIDTHIPRWNKCEGNVQLHSPGGSLLACEVEVKDEDTTYNSSVGIERCQEDDAEGEQLDFDAIFLEDGLGVAEPAIKYTYSPRKAKWTRREVSVQLSAMQLGEGTMRYAFPLTDLSLPAGQQRCVAKVFRSANAREEAYFADVEMHSLCSALAKQYNRFNPPKKVTFTEPCVIQCLSRTSPGEDGLLTLIVEPLLEGQFTKYSNNAGYVDYLAARATPHAFSHFTYHFTRGQLLVCDIQGVGDMYTDPQIHSNKKGGGVWGEGDLGAEGMERFFATHQCSSLCQHFQLQPPPPDAPLPPVQWKPLDMVPPKVVERFAAVRRARQNPTHNAEWVGDDPDVPAEVAAQKDATPPSCQWSRFLPPESLQHPIL